MATWSPARDVPDTTRTGRRPWVWILLSIALMAVIALGYAYYVAHAALPQLDGRLFIPGLSAPVTVTRDAHGVPTIEAQSLTDLFFAQGYVTAQDRLWQMDIMRRYAAGEISEIIGPATIEHDREQRILGLRQVAAKTVAALPARDRAFMEAYANGVNAFMQAHMSHLPVEFHILRYKPTPWKTEDCILLGARLVQELNHGTFEAALEREKILARLGPDLTADLFVNSSWRDRPPTMQPHRLSDEVDEKKKSKRDDEEDEDEDMDSGSDNNVARGVGVPNVPSDWRRGPELVPGSNDWVVAGAHTVTGKPLLSNDMHLHHQMPNLWYEAHLHSGTYNVVGVTLPGLPFVIVGHNEHIAWGVTNVGPTVEDLYVETFNNQGAYQTPQGWLQPQRRQEVIHVKGTPDVIVDVTTTRHGPIISDLVQGETRKLALRWTLYDSLFDPFFDVDSAKNWTEFRHALSLLDSPGQNFVYADVDGHIGYQTTGHVPIRKGSDGTLPVPGNDDAHEWNGYVPFEKLPTVFDPPSGVIGTANGRITPDGYPYVISTEWDAPWRTERIYRVLESGKRFAPGDMLSLQTDVYSAFDRLCAEHFVYALDHVRGPSKRAQQARELMRDWDGRMTMDSAATTITLRARQELVRLLLEPKLGAAPLESKADGYYTGSLEQLSWKTYRWFMSSVWIENVLMKKPQRWLPSNYENYDALLTAAVEAAVSASDAPADLGTWKWGKFHPIEIEHPVLGRLPGLSRWVQPGLHDQSGGSYTVKQVGRDFGPSERFTANLGNFDHSTLNTVTGQAGNFLSPYYMDQWKAWYEGTTFVLPFSPAAVQSAKSHQLVLEPAK
jgi:penicillin amidase